MVMANEKDAIEMSLTENYYNLAMNPADACEAFRNMIDKEGKIRFKQIGPVTEEALLKTILPLAQELQK